MDPPASEARHTAKQRLQIQDHLLELTQSPAFANSKRAIEFLEHVVHKSLAGEQADLRERTIGAALFGRPINYDTANDAVVRVRATEVRRRLAEFYASAGACPLRVVLPPGTYSPVFEWQATPNTTAAPTPDAPHPQLPAWHSKAIKLVAALLVLLGLGVALLWIAHLSRTADPQLTSIAVLPLQNLSGDKTEDYFADGLSDGIIAKLGEVSALQVVSETSSSTYKHRQATVPQIQKELGVDAIIEGSVQRDAQHVMVSIRLIDARRDRQLWSHSYRLDRADLLALESDIAEAVAQQVRVEVTPAERASFARKVFIDSKAQDDYLRALRRIDVGDLVQAAELLKQAIASDSRYAQAHATLSLTYGSMGSAGTVPAALAYQQAGSEAQAAEALDDTLADTHVALAQSAADLHWDWTTERNELERAIGINPSSTAALRAYATHMERFGNFDGAVRTMQRAVTLDPVSSHAYVDAALVYHLANQDDKALDAIVLAGQLPHQTTAFTFPLGVIYIDKGLLPQAIEQFRLFGSHPYGLGHLGYALALDHQQGAAEQVLAQLRSIQQTTGVGTYEQAIIEAGLGRKTAALDTLEHAFQLHDKGMEYLKIDPCLQTLHGEVRYQTLVRRMHLN